MDVVPTRDARPAAIRPLGLPSVSIGKLVQLSLSDGLEGGKEDGRMELEHARERAAHSTTYVRLVRKSLRSPTKWTCLRATLTRLS